MKMKKWRKNRNVRQLVNFNNQNIIILIIKKSKNISINLGGSFCPKWQILPLFSKLFKSTSLYRGFQKVGKICLIRQFLPTSLFLLFSAFLYISIYLYIYISPLGRVRIIIRINNNKTLISIVIKTK